MLNGHIQVPLAEESREKAMKALFKAVSPRNPTSALIPKSMITPSMPTAGLQPRVIEGTALL